MAICLSFIFTSVVKAQLSDGSIAPDWTLNDLNGNTHHLYGELSAGKTAFIDFSATWCGPCWGYHVQGNMKTIYNNYGPDGTDEARVYYLEAAGNTNEACLYGPSGCVGGTQGDWVTGTPYPIMHLEGSDLSIASDYQIAFYPTVYAVLPNQQTYEIGQASVSTMENWIQSGNLDIQFSAVEQPVCSEDGYLFAQVTGGYGNVSLSWSNGVTGAENPNIGAGEYTVTATDQNNVSVSKTYVLENGNPEIVLEEANVSNISCNGLEDGEISILAGGGSGGFSYSWDTGETSDLLTQLAAGTYTVTITDAIGCTKTESFEIVEPDILEVSAEAEMATCGQSDGTISIIAFGGFQPFTYDIGTGETWDSDYITQVAPGTYTVTVTDAGGCTESTTVTVETTGGPNTSIQAGATELNCSTTSITLDGSGSDIAGNTVQWTKDGVNFSTDATISVTEAGTYVLSITDANGCVGTQSSTITANNNTPVANAGQDKILDCTNTSVSLSGAMSTSGSYQWTTADGNIVGASNTESITVDAPGTYTLTLTNADGTCTDTDVAVVTEDTAVPTAAIQASQPELNCAVTSLTLDAMGSDLEGNTVAWTKGGAAFSSESAITVTEPDTYTLTIMDPNGCSASETITVPFVSTAEAGAGAELSCTQSTAVLSGQASAQATYSWTTEDGNIVSGANTLTPTVDKPGSYVMTVTWIDGECSAWDTAVVTGTTEAPDVNIAATGGLTCTESQVTLAGSSAGSDLQYAWTDGDGNDLGTASSINTTAAGTYTLTVTNPNTGCVGTQEVTVTENTTPPTMDAGEGVQITCTDGSPVLAGASVTGDGNFTYMWTTSDGNIVGGANTLTPEVDASGTYTLTVTNTDNGCVSTDVATVSEFINTPISNYTSSTTDKTAQFTSDAGGENITYAWNFGDGNTSTDSNPSHTYAEYGTYDVCLTISNECGSDEKCTSITMSSYNVFSSAAIVPVTCHGGSDGSIDVTVSDESLVSSYLWNNGATTQDISNLEAGTYELVMTSSDNLTQTVSFVVEQPTILAVTSETNEDEGSIDLSIDGGVSPYTVSWSNGETTEDLTGLSTGTYVATVTDANGCTTTHEVTIVKSSVEDIDEVDFIDVYPNPVNNNLYIDIDLATTTDVDVKIYNMVGALVHQELHTSSTKNITIDMQERTTGSYILVLTTSEESYKKMFIKN